MSADELRARFSQVTESVVPMEDPLGRLMSRRRKRFRARLASLVTLTAAVVTGGLAAPTTLIGVASAPGPEPDIVTNTTNVSREEYLDRLVKAPIRGNLSGDPEMISRVRKAFSEFEPRVRNATEPNLIFLNRTDQMLQAVVVYTGGEQPIAVAAGSTPSASEKDLIVDPLAYYTALTPFLVMPVADFAGKARSVVGLAPPGCAIEHSAKGGFTVDGAWRRSYDPEPTGDYVVRNGRTVNELWRVSCDGKVREVRTADDYLDGVGAEDNAGVMYDRVVRFSGAAASKGTVQWHGKLPGRKSEATLVSPNLLPGPAMLAVGPFPKAVLATDLLEQDPVPSPTATGRDEEWSMIALGVASDGLSVVRLPQAYGDRTVLGDQVFVYSKFAAVRIEAVDAKQRVVAAAALSDDVAILTFSPGLASRVQAITAKGKLTYSVRFTELSKGSRVLGDLLFKDW